MPCALSQRALPCRTCPLFPIIIVSIDADALLSHFAPVKTTGKTFAHDKLFAPGAGGAQLIGPDFDFAGASGTEYLFRFWLPDLLSAWADEMVHYDILWEKS
jgi:hypothetical protein